MLRRRKFYKIPRENLQYLRHDRKVKNLNNIEELFEYIENSSNGKDLTFTGNLMDFGRVSFNILKPQFHVMLFV